MNAYELAEIMTVHDESRIWEHGLEIANMLRQQADRIAELEKYVGFKDSGYDIIQLPQQTKPLSDEEIMQISHQALENSALIPKNNFMIAFAKSIEERHGIK